MELLKHPRTNEVLKQLARLTAPGYTREHCGRVFKLHIALAGVEWPVWRRFQVPSSYTFWDLYVAINNLLLWRFSCVPQFVLHDVNQNETVAFDLESAWQKRLDSFFPERSSEGVCLVGSPMSPWQIGFQCEEILRASPDDTYPKFLDGAGSAPPEDLGSEVFNAALAESSEPMTFEFDPEVKYYGVLYGNHRYDPADIVFDDPDEEWIRSYWEQWIMDDCIERLRRRVRDSRYRKEPCGIELPVRSRDLLLKLGLAPEGLLTSIYESRLCPGFVTLLLEKNEIPPIADAIAMKRFESQDVRLHRQLEHVEWYFQAIQTLIVA